MSLEQSLDTIIDGTGKPQRGNKERRRNKRPPQRLQIPALIAEAAANRPMLRLRNIHSDLNGADLLRLFEQVAAVDFVKFDPRNELVAYVCFQLHHNENNRRAVTQFDGKKAMGKTLVVENATSLADRIARPAGPALGGRIGVPERAPRGEAPRQKKAKARKPKVAKSAEDLDAELSAYMEGIQPDAMAD